MCSEAKSYEVAKLALAGDYLRRILPLEGVEITGYKIERNRERTVAIFPREGRAARETAVGGIGNRSFYMLRVTLLIRWGRDGAAAEAKAAQIYAAVAEHDANFGFVRAVNDAPVWVGMDERGVYEYVVDVDFYVYVEGIPGRARDDD